jgi:CBS domain-containing protein
MSINEILANKGSEVVSVDCDTPVRDAVTLLAERRIGAMPVIKDGEVVGIVSERDIIQCLKSDGAAFLDWPVSKVMSAPAVTVEPNMSALAGLALITQRRIRHLPVVEGGEIVGLVSIGDLVKYRMDRIEAEAAAMRNYIQSA